MHRFLRKSLICVIICFLLALAPCAPDPDTPSSRVDLHSLDLASLQGRRIVIDPGHGGRFAGAVGSRGLRESDVNLAVGLHLWGLLDQAGAQAWLTRSADVDLCSHNDPNLGEDLDARAHFSNDLKADLFVSIHHNSDVKDRKKNNIQIYYKLTDSGPSQDLARSVAHALREGQSIEDVFVFPGNYRVLRNTEAAAILGEASFITNRRNERRLALSNQLRREAEDYFLGILTYCQKGIPQVIDPSPAQATVVGARPQITARIIGGSGGESIDPENVTLYLDNVPVSSAFNPHTGMITHVPDAPLKNGSHSYYVEARNLNGNSNQKKPIHFLVSLPPASLEIASAFSSLPANKVGSSRLEVVSTDAHGNPVIDGTLISLHATAGGLDNDVVSTVDGRGIGYFFPPAETKDVVIEARCQDAIAETTISCGPVDDALVRLAIEDRQHNPLGNVLVQDGAETLGISDANGLVFIRSGRAGERPVVLERPGYASKEERVIFEKGAFRQEQFALFPREEGLLLEKGITLDPEPWDEDTAREFDLRADEEQANLFVVKKLKGLLEEAGARIAETWDDRSQHPTLGGRVLVGENFDGDYFITLTHRKEKPYIAHYFRSQTGKQLAQAIAQSLRKELSLRRMATREAADFTIIHPRCPSIVVNFGKKQLPGKGAARQDVLEKEVRGVYEGLLQFLRKENGGNGDV